jgi:hypothetical protein
VLSIVRALLEGYYMRVQETTRSRVTWVYRRLDYAPVRAATYGNATTAPQA